MTRRQYDIPDPWHIRLREWVARWTVCLILGHRRTPGFDGGMKPCRRCDR